MNWPLGDFRHYRTGTALSLAHKKLLSLSASIQN